MQPFHWLAARWQARNRGRTRRRYEIALSIWQAEEERLQRELSLALAPAEASVPAAETGFVLHKGEEILLVLSGAGLVEPRQLPGHWVGGYSGVSLRLMKGVTYHVGATRGTYVGGPDAPTRLAVGTATLTDQRVVFQSSQQAREFLFSKLLGYQHDPNAPVTYFQVSNRQKVSGIEYDLESARAWRFRLALALARVSGDGAQFAQHIRDEIASHESNQPRLVEA